MEKKARIIGYTRMIRRSIRRQGLETPEGRAEIEHWKAELLELLDEVDSLLFLPNVICLDATKEKLPQAIEFVDAHLEELGCSPKTQMEMELSIEEIFINIANYAYAPGTGEATIRVETAEDPKSISVSFLDQGMQYNPLLREEPDVNLTAEERSVGGLGIFLVKRYVNDLQYEYRDGSNILTLKKVIS